VTPLATEPQPRRAEMFPTLTAEQIDHVRVAGRERAFDAGEILLEQGETAAKFLVVVDGAIEIIHPGTEYTVAVIEAGGFSGERSRSRGRLPRSSATSAPIASKSTAARCSRVSS
jgi:CRP/FNR family cyclic AMP-dependent transcriptional regulator